jgi:hypothetical protein
MRDEQFPARPWFPRWSPRRSLRRASREPVPIPVLIPPGRREASSLSYALAFAAVYLIWGSTYLGIRVAVQSLPPFLLAGARSFSAGLLLLLALRWRGARAATALEWRRAALAGTLMLAAGNGLVTWAETYVPRTSPHSPSPRYRPTSRCLIGCARAARAPGHGR